MSGSTKREDLKRGHIFWCRTFWGGELALRRVVWVLGMVGVEGVSRCVWQGVTFFGVTLFGVGGGADGGWGWGCGGGADGVRGCMSMNILFRSFCYWGHTFLVALFCANFLWIYCLEGFCCWGVTLSDVALHWVYEFHWISKLIEFMDLRSH